MSYGFLSQSFPPTSKYNESDIKDLTGMVAIVTGSNVGIGFETARVLLQKNAKVYLACRSPEKALAAIESLKLITGGKEGIWLNLDLSSIKSTKLAAEKFLSKEKQLHLLFNNAGVMRPPLGSKPKDGYELQWGTNCLGHYVFTETLIPLLISTAASSSPHVVRIITTASSAQMFAPSGDKCIDLQDQFSSSGMSLYGSSKIGNVIMARYWSEMLKDKSVLSISLNSGNIRTELTRNSGILAKIIGSVICYPAAKGAITQLYAATSPGFTTGNTQNIYLVPWCRIDEPGRAEVKDVEFCKNAMALMTEQCDKVLNLELAGRIA